MAELFTEKSHPATPRRRQQARAQGHVAKSQDLVSALVMTAGLLAIWITGATFGQFITDYAIQQLGDPTWQSFTTSSAVDTWQQAILSAGRSLAPVMAIVLLVAIVANVGQTGFLFSPQRIAMDGNRIQPLTGLRRMISASNLAQAPLGFCKTVVVISVVLLGLWGQRAEIMQLPTRDTHSMVRLMFQLIFTISLRVAFSLVAVAFIDYLFQRWQYERSLRLTDEEMREELRDSQRHPQPANRRKSARQTLATGQIQQLISNCDLILTDGSQLAVALQCDPSTTAVPRVITKGQGSLAEEIVFAAQVKNILLQNDSGLARNLFRESGRQEAIHPDRFQQLARIYHEACQGNGLGRGNH